MREAHSGAAVALVAVGALLVGSIRWTVGGEGKENEQVRRGDELGYFAYGGSTVIALFPRGAVAYDQDLLDNSRVPMETLVKVCLFARCASFLHHVLLVCTICFLFAWVHTRPHSTLRPDVLHDVLLPFWFRDDYSIFTDGRPQVGWSIGRIPNEWTPEPEQLG